MSSIVWNIGIGNDFQKLLQFKQNSVPMNLTGYSFKMQIRPFINSDEIVYELLSPTQIDISDASNGNIILNIDHLVTETFESMDTVFDLQWTTPDNLIETVIGGHIEITETVTR